MMKHRNIALRTDGFVRNIHSRNPYDVIRADVVLARMEKQANRGGVVCTTRFMSPVCWVWPCIT